MRNEDELDDYWSLEGNMIGCMGVLGISGISAYEALRFGRKYGLMSFAWVTI